MEENILTLKERVKILQSKYDESESRRIKLSLDREDSSKTNVNKDQLIHDLKDELDKSRIEIENLQYTIDNMQNEFNDKFRSFETFSEE